MKQHNIDPAALAKFGEWIDRQKPSPKTEREMNLADTLQLYHDMFHALMSAWAEQPFFSEESDCLDTYMDDVRAEVMNLLPLIIKMLRGMDIPAADPSVQE